LNEGKTLYAQSGRQDWGMANAADSSDDKHGTVVYPKVLEDYIKMAIQQKKYVYPALRVVIDPDGVVYLRQPARDKPVWQEIQELIDR